VENAKLRDGIRPNSTPGDDVNQPQQNVKPSDSAKKRKQR
jgi:hypothetical protein